MFDINLIREQPDLVRQALRDRNNDPEVVDQVLALDVERRALLGRVETLKGSVIPSDEPVFQPTTPAS